MKLSKFTDKSVLLFMHLDFKTSQTLEYIYAVDFKLPFYFLIYRNCVILFKANIYFNSLKKRLVYVRDSINLLSTV